jgi:biopolymer transport protein ExbD
MKIARRKLKVEIPTVAMGDIAFNLLVFFVILARSQDDSHVQWDPAQSGKVENVGNPRVSVSVEKENPENPNNPPRTFLNGRPISLGELSTGIENLLGNAPAGERRVLLKISKETPAATFEPILEAVSQAGGEIVHVLEEDKK